MTANKDLKRLVRARLGKTGESYAAALRQIRQHVPRTPSAALPTLRCVERHELGFALQVPTDWREDRPDAFHSPDEVARFFGTGPNMQNYLVFRRPAEAGEEALDVTHRAETHLRREGYANFRRSRAEVGGLPGARLDFDMPAGSGEGVWAVRHYFAIAAGHVFIASFGTMTPQQDARLLDGLAAGFELTGDPPGAPAAGSSELQTQRVVRRIQVEPDIRRRFSSYSLLARQVVLAALEAALKRGRGAIEEEDLLSGVAAVESARGLAVLASLGISQAQLQRAAETAFRADSAPADRIDDVGPEGEAASLRFSPSAERVLTAAENEASALGHGYMRDEHLLLGLIANGAGPAAMLLARLGTTRSAIRTAVLQSLDAAGMPRRPTDESPAPGEK